MPLEFEWDVQKSVANLAKHGVSFDDAGTVFDDPLFIDFYDPDHSDDEERYIIMGQSRNGVLMVVSYTERGSAVRLISARKASRREREFYEHDRD